MIKRFDDEKISIVIRSRINKRSLKPTETVSEYYNETRKEADKIDMTSEEIMFAFLKGLPKNHIQQIVVQNPETPEQALDLAKTLEQMEALSKSEDSKTAL